MSYTKAVALLSEGEKNRLLCIALNCDMKNIDWPKASAEFGSASASSMQRMWYQTMAKIKAHKDDTNTANGDQADAGSSYVSAGAAKGKKRNAQGAEGMEKPAKKSRPSKQSGQMIKEEEVDEDHHERGTSGARRAGLIIGHSEEQTVSAEI